MGPSYANLFVGYIENLFFSSYHGPSPDLTNVTWMTASALLHPADKSQPFYYFSQFLSLAFLEIKLTIQSSVTTVYLLDVGYKPTDSNVRRLIHNTSDMQFHSLNFLD